MNVTLGHVLMLMNSRAAEKMATLLFSMDIFLVVVMAKYSVRRTTSGSVVVSVVSAYRESRVSKTD